MWKSLKRYFEPPSDLDTCSRCAGVNATGKFTLKCTKSVPAAADEVEGKGHHHLRPAPPSSNAGSPRPGNCSTVSGGVTSERVMTSGSAPETSGGSEWVNPNSACLRVMGRTTCKSEAEELSAEVEG